MVFDECNKLEENGEIKPNILFLKFFMACACTCGKKELSTYDNVTTFELLKPKNHGDDNAQIVDPYHENFALNKIFLMKKKGAQDDEEEHYSSCKI